MQSKDLLLALESLEREKNIKREDTLKTIEDALISALRKHLGKTAVLSAKIDTEEGTITAYRTLIVSEEVTNPETEISLQDAKAIKPSAQIGEEIVNTLNVEDFSRIAAQIAKQVLIQKVRGIERDNLYKEFKPREGEVVTGLVRRFSDRDIIVDLGKAEAILPYCEQIRKERFVHGGRVKAIITRVLNQTDFADVKDDPVLSRYKSAAYKMDKGQRGPYIILSRTSPEFLKELMKVEIPELSDGIIETKAIVRDPGFRAKVVVKSNDNKIDPIGTCVGMRGIRIRAVTNELSGEKIDLINYSDDSVTNIVNSLSPAKVLSVRINSMEKKQALVIVPDDQLAIAIGKDWQNIKLASKVCGWELEVKSESQKNQEGLEAAQMLQETLADVEGIGPKIAEVLVKAGFNSIEKIASLTPEHLATLQGVGEKTAEKIIEGAKKYLAEHEEAEDDTNEETH
ncbi:transcription termination/antitermination protein NusA [Candidatus Proelusimicrobium volucris]|uniref:transcription termination/antitermination protein NusA n=1 Tax=Candidatus Proelusimicrobium volucris TaxID=3416225 RepID=UPI003D11C14B